MKKIIVLNHKSYLSTKEAKNYPIDINDYIRTDQTVIICPNNIYIPYFAGKYNFYLGSQNISHTNITGETTGNQLKSIGVKYTIIGHHERINNQIELKKDINQKVKEALNNNIIPIIVIGETYYENQLKKTGEIIAKQLKEYLKDIEVKQDIIIAYEPNWSFEGKEIPNQNHIYEVIDLIKNIIKRKYNVNIKVIYGGHINKENIKDLDKIPNINGYLIGKTSTNINEIKQIFNNIE